MESNGTADNADAPEYLHGIAGDQTRNQGSNPHDQNERLHGEEATDERNFLLSLVAVHIFPL
jgi:hypothetical protein